MNNLSRLNLAVLLMLGGTFVSNQAEEAQSTWHKWKKPVIATTMIVGGIAGWLLLDYYLNGKFSSQLDKTTKALVQGNKDNSFFEDNGVLRKHPFISDAEFKDYQLYENARFGDIYTPFSQAAHTMKYSLDSFRYGFTQGLSSLWQHIKWSTDSFNTQLLLNQVGSKLCFITALTGGYLFSRPDAAKEDAENATDAKNVTDDSKTVES